VTGAGTVAVLRALGLGDALTAVPALRGLRRAFPDHRLVLAAPPPWPDWLVVQGVVDQTVRQDGLTPTRWPGEAPQIAVNLHGRGPQSHEVLRGWHPGTIIGHACAEAGFDDGPPWDPTLHEVDRWCRLVEWAGGPCGRQDLRLSAARWPTNPGAAHRAVDAGAEVRALDSGMGNGMGGTVDGTVVVHPGAASRARRWPTPRWRTVVARLATRHRVVVTGTDAEAALCHEVASGADTAVNLCGRLSPQRLADLVAGCGLLLCGDTGVAHLATALGTPSVILFGPTPPSAWGPCIDQQLHPVLWHPEVATASDPHAHEVDSRLLAITTEEVLAAADELLTTARCRLVGG
jgi:ADP-heptose:LPS heptosyltransferase